MISGIRLGLVMLVGLSTHNNNLNNNSYNNNNSINNKMQLKLLYNKIQVSIETELKA